MKNMKKKILLCIAFLLTAFPLLAACGATDVIANYSVKAFNGLTATLGAAGYEYADGKHKAVSPDGTEKFIFGGQIAIEIDIAEFRAAGLERMRLMELMDAAGQGNMTLDGDLLTVFLAGANVAATEDKESAFEQNIRDNRNALMYSADMGHFGIALDGMHMFEWAQHADKNDKDMVFVLPPDLFKDAGLDTERLDKWVYTEIEMMDKNGKKSKEYKLVKFFDF
ncbi:MAG: hypothetical protein LBL66_07140 [Clostridiales bacterium]|jgi:hypothetical protein|nr:hypothetical protein [Clostridiales bacterium]